MLKKFDYKLIQVALAILALLLWRFGGLLVVLRLLLGLAVCALMLYWKLFPYVAQMDAKYQRWMHAAGRVIGPLKALTTKLPPLTLGPRLTLDTGLFAICAVMIILIILI